MATELCPNCQLPDPHKLHGSTQVCLGAQQEATHAILRNAGDRALCSGCSAEIFWLHHRNGKRTPYDPTGVNHFITCPKADQFSTRKAKTNG